MSQPGTRLAERMDGLLFFPVTPFGPDGQVDLQAYRQHLQARLAAGPAAVFACCGTGEFFSLGLDEYAAAVRVAVEVAGGTVPVVGGVGYGTALAGAFADAAAEAGADGLLAMPPYLVDGGPGLPTAEMTQLPYRAAGVAHYSSAVFCFAPDIALAFYRAYRAGDDATADRLLDGFFRPYVELRNQGKGYAVALVKAGVRLDGLDVGPVRPPLAEPDPAHVARLAELVKVGRELVA